MKNRRAITDSGMIRHAEIYVNYMRIAKDPVSRYLAKSRIYELCATNHASPRYAGAVIQIINKYDDYRIEIEKIVNDLRIDGNG